MNKYINSFLFLSHLLCASHLVATVNPFAKLTGITKNAQIWVESLDSLPVDMQLAYLNLFALLALNNESAIPTLIKCIEYIESQTEMHPSREELNTIITKPIQKYLENIETKISHKKNLT